MNNNRKKNKINQKSKTIYYTNKLNKNKVKEQNQSTLLHLHLVNVLLLQGIQSQQVERLEVKQLFVKGKNLRD